MIFRRIFARTVADEAANIRESIRRDNLRGILGDPHYVRGEHVDGYERELRRRHIIREEVRA